MSRTQPVVILCLLTVFFSACFTRVHFPLRRSHDPAVWGRAPSGVERTVFDAQAISARLADQLADHRLQRGQVDRGQSPSETHAALEITVPSVGENGQEGNLVTATYYAAAAPGRHRLVILLPIYGSSEYPQRRVLQRLLRPTEVPTHVLAIHGRQPLFDWPALGDAPDEARFWREIERAAGAISATRSDVQRLVDWAVRRPEVDPERIGLVGFSIGAIVGSLVMGLDDRLAAGVFVMGGANLEEIFASCRGKAGGARQKICGRFGWTREQFAARLREPFAAVNPARHAGAIDPRDVLVIDTSLDRCIPESARADLWEAMGRPERISLSYGHKIAFLSMTPLGFHFTTRRILDFLDRRLHPGRTLATPRPGAPDLARTSASQRPLERTSP